MKKLLVEVYKGQSLQEAQDQNQVPSGMMRLTGVFAVVDDVNRNNRFYPKNEYSKHIDKLSKRILETNDVLGEMEHPKSMTVDYNNVSHKVEKIWLKENGDVMGQVLLMDTPKGKIAQSIVRSGTPVHISSRAIGDVTEGGAVTLEHLETFDLVGTPGFKQASLTPVTESVDSAGKVISESYAYDIDDENHVIESAKLSGMLSVLEQKFTSLIDNKVDEAIKAAGGEKPLSREDMLEVAKTYVAETAAPDIQKYLQDELKEAIENSNQPLTKAAVIEMIDQRFINVHSNVIENWAINEFAPEIQKWNINEFAPQIQKWTVDEFAPQIQKWFVNEVAPEIQKWNINEFAPQIQTWFVNEVAPEIQKWNVNEFAPQIQKWNVNEFAPEIQKWILDEFAPKLESWLSSDFAKTLSEAKADKDDDKDDDKADLYKDGKGKDDEDVKARDKAADDDEKEKSAKVDESLSDIDAIIAKSKEASRKIEETAIQTTKRKLDEQFAHGPEWLKHIPEQYKSVWITLSESAKDTISRQASIRTFRNDHTLINEFWSSRNFTELIKENSASITERTSIKQRDNGRDVSESQQNLINLTQLLQS